MPKKRVFVSGRIEEMRHFREVPRALNQIEMIKTAHDNWYHRLLKALAQ